MISSLVKYLADRDVTYKYYEQMYTGENSSMLNNECIMSVS